MQLQILWIFFDIQQRREALCIIKSPIQCFWNKDILVHNKKNNFF